MPKATKSTNSKSVTSLALRIWTAVILAMTLGAPSAVLANTKVTSNWSSVYSNVTPSCSNCHVNGVGSQVNSTLSEYAQRLTTQLSSSGFYPTSGSNRIQDVSDANMQTAMEAIRVYLAPRVDSVAALDGNNVLATQNSPSGTLSFPAETSSLRVTFDPGIDAFFGTFNGASVPTVNDPGFSSTIPAVSISGSNNVFSITLPSASDRRADRQSALQPYALTFAPTNTMLFDGGPTIHATNQFSVETANVPPVAVADTFAPGLLEVQDSNGTPIPYELNVLTRGSDFDPDHSSASLTVSPPTPALSSAYGSVAVNASNTGYIYTAPATLDPAERTVTFQYSAVDEESASSMATTVTITVPAAAPVVMPKVFVARDDLFTLTEGGSLTGADVKTDNGSGPDDLDGAVLADVEFMNNDDPEGTLTFRTDGTFDFTPDENFFGETYFMYRLTDGVSTSNARVTLRVIAENDLPTVTPFTLLSKNESREPFSEDLLNPSNVADVDGDVLAVQNVTVSITQRPAGTMRTIVVADAVSISGSTVTVRPTAFAELDNDEFGDVLVSYDVSDGTDLVANTLSVTIIGLDNGLGRQAGAYADTLSARYVSTDFGAHFDGQSQAPSACLTCHATLATIDADVDTVDECQQTPAVFTAYGLELCLNRDAGTPALTDLLRRMTDAEPNYAPRLAATATLQVLQSAATGSAIGAPLTTASTGRDVFGATADIHSYLISAGANGNPASTDPSGQFRIDADGQITVASNTLAAGTYTLVVLPVNDASQRDNSGAPIAAPGFFLQTPGPESAVTIEVLGDLPTPVDDAVNASINAPVDVNVLANDTGGMADTIRIVTASSNGTVIVNSDQTVTYTPNTDYVGPDSFTYSSQNTTGPSNNDATVRISVLPGTAVVAVDDTATAIQGRTTIVDVLANDKNTRLSGAGATIVTLTSEPDPATEGSVTLNGQMVSFVPVAGFTGTALFTYNAANPSGTGPQGSDASVTLSVVAVGDGAITAAVTDPELNKVAQSFEQSCVLVRDSGQSDLQSQQFLDVCADLTVAATDSEDLTQAMRALRNEEHFASVDATATVARGLGGVVDRRLTQIRNGAARGFNTDGVTLSFDGQSFPTELLAQAARGYFGLGEGLVQVPSWGLFIAGDLAWAERDPSSNSSGFELQASNLMIGYDRVLNDLSSLGIALGYSETSTDFAGGGTLESEGIQASLYGIQEDFVFRDLTLEGYMSVGRMKFDSQRRIQFSNGGNSVDTYASATYDETYINIVPRLSYSRVLGDYNDPIGALRTATQITWSASLDYLWMDIDDYTETGGNGLALNVQSETYQSLILALGVDASRPVYFGPESRAEIYGGLQLRGELLDKDRTASSAFVAGGPDAPRFLVSEEGTYGLGGRIEVGTVFAVGPYGQIDLNYDYNFAQGGLTTQHLSFGFSQQVLGNDNLSINVSRNLGSADGDGLSAELDYLLRF